MNISSYTGVDFASELPFGSNAIHLPDKRIAQTSLTQTSIRNDHHRHRRERWQGGRTQASRPRRKRHEPSTLSPSARSRARSPQQALIPTSHLSVDILRAISRFYPACIIGVSWMTCKGLYRVPHHVLAAPEIRLPSESLTHDYIRDICSEDQRRRLIRLGRVLMIRKKKYQRPTMHIHMNYIPHILCC